MRHGWDATNRKCDLSRRRLGSAKVRTALSIWPGEGYCRLGAWRCRRNLGLDPSIADRLGYRSWLAAAVVTRGAWNWRCIIGVKAETYMFSGQGWSRD